MKKKCLSLVLLFAFFGTSNVMAEETSKEVQDQTIETTQESQSKSVDEAVGTPTTKSEPNKSQDVKKNDITEEYKQEQLKILRIDYLNGYLTEAEYNGFRQEMTKATSYEEVEAVWEKVQKAHPDVTNFNFHFSETYNGILVNIGQYKKKGSITNEQSEELTKKLNEATTVAELEAVNKELETLVSTNGSTGSSSSSTSETSSSSESTSETTDITTEKSDVQSKKGNTNNSLPKTGERQDSLLLSSGIMILIMTGSFGLYRKNQK